MNDMNSPLALCARRCLFAAVAVTMSLPVFAGSVFMKNGYILHGKIVDRDDYSIVMGWPNGKVTIARRFVESFTLEPSEESALEELEAIRQELQNSDPTAELTMLSQPVTTTELPSTLEGFLNEYDLGPSAKPVDEVTPVSEPSVVVIRPDTDTEAGSEVEPTVDVLPRDQLGERIQSDVQKVSFRPPLSWVERPSEEALWLVGTPRVEGEIAPTLTVLLLPQGPLSSEEYIELLKSEQKELLAGYRVLSEGWREVGTERAYEVVAESAYDGRVGTLRQCLVLRGEELWLLTATTANSSPQGDFGVVEESLKTFSFLAD